MKTTATYKKTKKELQDIYNLLYKGSISEAKPPYTEWQLKFKDANVTAYISGKLLIQGKGTEAIMELLDTNTVSEYIEYPEAGSDEVGCGDYFGPIVVGACVVPNKTIADMLINAGLKDTKSMSDKKVLEVAKLIKQHCHTKVITLSPERYNQWHNTKNMVEIKAILHSKAWFELNKSYALPPRKIIDQFCPADKYYEIVGKRNDRHPFIFETKADGKYISVMCAAVLAREKYLMEMKSLANEWGMEFLKGANQQVDLVGVNFVKNNSIEDLSKVAKINFRNTAKIHRLLGYFNKN